MAQFLLSILRVNVYDGFFAAICFAALVTSVAGTTTSPPQVSCDLVTPCLNGGTCGSRGDALFECNCPADYTGDLCQTPVDQTRPIIYGCPANIILNITYGERILVNWTAPTTNDSSGVQSFTPSIEPGSLFEAETTRVTYTAVDSYGNTASCDFDVILRVIDPCNSSPCENGGSCSPAADLSSYTCTCAGSFTGDTCQTEDPCGSGPCANGGSCSPAADLSSYTCTCAGSFTGDTCQTEMTEDPCGPSPCENGGSCSPAADLSSFTCTCDSSFTGDTCQSEVAERGSPLSSGAIAGIVIGVLAAVFIAIGVILYARSE